MKIDGHPLLRKRLASLPEFEFLDSLELFTERLMNAAYVRFNNRRGIPQLVSTSYLKDRLSRAKRKIRANQVCASTQK